jgi:hypothetical protein
MGFRLVTISVFTRGVTETVTGSIRSSDAMLQIISPRPDENLASMSMTWLDYEYGAANGVGCPVLRLLDVTRFNRSEWEARIRTHRDHAIVEFRSDVSDEDLYLFMRRQIERLAAELLGRP